MPHRLRTAELWPLWPPPPRRAAGCRPSRRVVLGRARWAPSPLICCRLPQPSSARSRRTAARSPATPSKRPARRSAVSSSAPLAGLAAAVALSLSRGLRESLFPFALASQAVPIAAITPLIVLLAGRGAPAILTVVAISAFFPMLINATRGLGAADAECHELLHSLAASRAQRLRLVELPGALPYVFAALKIGAASSFITAMVGEWIGSNVGLGYLVVISGQYFKVPLLWAAIVTTSALTLLFVGLVTSVERFATPWARREGAHENPPAATRRRFRRRARAMGGGDRIWMDRSTRAALPARGGEPVLERTRSPRDQRRRHRHGGARRARARQRRGPAARDRLRRLRRLSALGAAARLWARRRSRSSP